MTIRQLPDLSHLYQTITSIESEAECASLLEDLGSQNELRALNQRLEVSAMLLAGDQDPERPGTVVRQPGIRETILFPLMKPEA